MDKISNWGNFPIINASLLLGNNQSVVRDLIVNKDKIIARGNGRCYGDSSLQTNMVSMLSFNKILSFDTQKGILTCEAGVLLKDILTMIIPKGFFLPVTPGTKLITVGGAIAANVHGKNHHQVGAFGKYVLSFKLLVADGNVKICSSTKNKKLFINTIGGMGLTGVILCARFRLMKIESSFMLQRSVRARNIYELFELFKNNILSDYMVAWIDCLTKGKQLGRSLLMLGEHAKIGDLTTQQAKKALCLSTTKQINTPFRIPTFWLNKWSGRAFNYLYYHRQRQTIKDTIIHYDNYFYPLDRLQHWNRLYGNNGFLQYQFVLPLDSSEEGIIKIVREIAYADCPVFLGVLKRLGEDNTKVSPLSFPMNGYTLALDYKVNKKTLKFLTRLDEIVVDYGGRLYLAKDARMSQTMFQQTYTTDFKHNTKFSSLQSERLGI